MEAFRRLGSVEFLHSGPQLPQVIIQPAAKPDREMFIPARIWMAHLTGGFHAPKVLSSRS